jgi:hypothetical protein
VSSILPLAALAALVTWTMSYGRRAKAAALAAVGAGPSADAGPSPSQEVGSPS